MSKILNFDRSNAVAIADELKNAMAPIAEKYGITLGRENVGFTPNRISFKVTAVIADGCGHSISEADFLKYAHLYGLKSEHLGKSVMLYNGKSKQPFTIVGLKASARKNCIYVESRTGKIFVVDPGRVKRAFAEAQER